MSVYKPTDDRPQLGRGVYRQVAVNHEAFSAVLGGEGPTGFAGRRDGDVIVVSHQYDADTAVIWANTYAASWRFVWELGLYLLGKPYVEAIRTIMAM